MVIFSISLYKSFEKNLIWNPGVLRMLYCLFLYKSAEKYIMPECFKFTHTSEKMEGVDEYNEK